MSNEIFISYRRDGAESLAMLLYERLTHEGYDVFLDVETLRSGKFNVELYKHIEECDDFLLLLPPNGLDRCVDEDDWVRLEIEHAMHTNKRIIPILMRNFSFPEKLPDSINDIRNYNGVKADIELFDGVILKLKKMLKSSCKEVNTKYQIRDNIDLSVEFINKEVFYSLSDTERKYDSQDTEYMMRHTFIREGKRGISPRKEIGTICYGDNTYEIYDVFKKDEKKYLYTLENSKKEKSILLSPVFFEVNNDDTVVKINDVFGFTEIFNYYTIWNRGLGFLPKTLYNSFLSMWNFITTDQNYATTLNKAMGNIGQEGGMQGMKGVVEQTIFKAENIMAPYCIKGRWKGKFLKEVFLRISLSQYNQIEAGDESAAIIVDGKYEKRPIMTPFNVLYYDCKVKTPLKGYTILDIASIDYLPNIFIVFAYPQRKGMIDLLDKVPTFFYIEKDEDGYLHISKINEENYDVYVAPLKERFSLVAAQIDNKFPNVFV